MQAMLSNLLLRKLNDTPAVVVKMIIFAVIAKMSPSFAFALPVSILFWLRLESACDDTDGEAGWRPCSLLTRAINLTCWLAMMMVWGATTCKNVLQLATLAKEDKFCYTLSSGWTFLKLKLQRSANDASLTFI